MSFFPASNEPELIEPPRELFPIKNLVGHDTISGRQLFEGSMPWAHDEKDSVGFCASGVGCVGHDMVRDVTDASEIERRLIEAGLYEDEFFTLFADETYDAREAIMSALWRAERSRRPVKVLVVSDPFDADRDAISHAIHICTKLQALIITSNTLRQDIDAAEGWELDRPKGLFTDDSFAWLQEACQSTPRAAPLRLLDLRFAQPEQNWARWDAFTPDGLPIRVLKPGDACPTAIELRKLLLLTGFASDDENEFLFGRGGESPQSPRRLPQFDEQAPPAQEQAQGDDQGR